MKNNWLILGLSVLLLVAAVFALLVIFPVSIKKLSAPVEKKEKEIIKWRHAFSPEAECLVPAGGWGAWYVGDRLGWFTICEPRLGGTSRIRSVASENENLQGIATLSDGGVIAVSLQGKVSLWYVNLSGDPLLKTERLTLPFLETEGSFMHAPLVGNIGGEEMMWLISQGDSVIYCLRIVGEKREYKRLDVVWKSEPTNRCDGRPAEWGGYLAYGNCNGVVYVHDAATGALHGTIDTGGQSDPMAGVMLAMPSGLMFIGTYLGNFLMIDPVAKTCLDKVKIADRESFATPVAIGETTVAMGTPDGRITLWETRDRKFKSIGEITIGKDGIDEMVFYKGKLWVLAGSSLSRVDVTSRTVTAFNIGDNMRCLTINPSDGTMALIADGDVVCIDLEGEAQ